MLNDFPWFTQVCLLPHDHLIFFFNPNLFIKIYGLIQVMLVTGFLVLMGIAFIFIGHHVHGRFINRIVCNILLSYHQVFVLLSCF